MKSSKPVVFALTLFCKFFMLYFILFLQQQVFKKYLCVIMVKILHLMIRLCFIKFLMYDLIPSYCKKSIFSHILCSVIIILSFTNSRTIICNNTAHQRRVMFQLTLLLRSMNIYQMSTLNNSTSR